VSAARALLAGTAAIALVVLAGCSGDSQASGPPSASGVASPSELTDRSGGSFLGLGLTPPQPRPAFTLTDTTGKPYRFAARTGGSPTLLFFGYTHCPDVCPTTLADIATALRHVPATVRSATQVVFVTTDVRRDTPAVLARYLAKFDADLPRKFVGLTGSQVAVNAAQVAAHVTLAEDDGLTHSAEVLLYGPDDYSRVAFLQSNNEADQVQHDLPLVAGVK
jgi:protein SCO1/2